MTEPRNPTKPTPLTRARAGGIVVPQRARWHGRLAAALIYGVIRGVDATLRYDLDDPSGAVQAIGPQPAIFCIYHNRLSLCLMLYKRYIQKAWPGRRMAAIVSASRDGGLLARVLELFDVEPVRGSSSRRGPQALRELTSWGERGLDLAITPDGPRGPRYIVQEGVVAIAQLTGLPIVPASFELQWKRRLNTWDKFLLPVPFSRCVVHLGELIRVPRDLPESERESWRLKVEARMREVTRD